MAERTCRSRDGPAGFPVSSERGVVSQPGWHRKIPHQPFRMHVASFNLRRWQFPDISSLAIRERRGVGTRRHVPYLESLSRRIFTDRAIANAHQTLHYRRVPLDSPGHSSTAEEQIVEAWGSRLVDGETIPREASTPYAWSFSMRPPAPQPQNARDNHGTHQMQHAGNRTPHSQEVAIRIFPQAAVEFIQWAIHLINITTQ